MKGKRKFLLTLVGLCIFLIIMLKIPAMDPFSLGMAIGLLVTPMVMGNVMEHKAENQKP